MKILMVITRGDSIGGAQIHVRDLCRGLVDGGHSVSVVTGAGGALTEALAGLGVPTQVCPSLLREIHPVRDLRSVMLLRRIIRDDAPDLVCGHSTKAGIVARIAARLAGTPCVFTAHGWAFADGVSEPKRTLYRVLERLVSPLASRVICVSEHDRRIGISAGMRASRLVTIHNGMTDTTELAARAQDAGRPMRAIMVARFAAQKDHRTVIEALRGVEGAELDLVGDGPDLESARSFAREAGVADRVRFLGARDDVAALLARSDVFVLSSHWEGFPLSTLEAMRAGLPVIVSDVGGAAEAVVDGVTGFVVPPRDPGALRDRLRELVAAPERRMEMGRSGRNRFIAGYTFSRMFDRTLEVYDAAIAAGRHPGRRGARTSGGGCELVAPVAATAKDMTGGD